MEELKSYWMVEVSIGGKVKDRYIGDDDEEDLEEPNIEQDDENDCNRTSDVEFHLLAG